MIKILELIRNEEVKWVSLGEVFKNIVTGKLNANKREENGKYPFYTCDEKPYRINTYAFDCEALLVSGNGSKVGHINYYKGKFNAYQRTYVLYELKENNDIKYIYYYLKFALKKYINNNIFKGSIPFITMPILTEFKIPIPSLETQRKIVDILDKFTEYKDTLNEELELRKKQYNYYKEMLLSQEYMIKKAKELCGEDAKVEEKRLGEVLGYEQPNKYIVSSTEYKESYKTPVLTAGQTFILGYTNEENGIFQASKENPVIIFDDFTTSNHWVDFDFKVKSSAMKLLRPISKEILFRYAYYCMKILKIDTTEHKRMWISKYSNLMINLPPLKVQEHIVEILDKFDKLTNDIKEGLPKEIELRTKQYEYYREKLLSF